MTQSPAKKSFFNRNVDLMNGPIFKSLFIFMLPILVSCLFQQLYNTVDTMIVGNVLGDTALAAIGACGAIYELLVGFGLGIGNGLAIVAARAYGAGDDDQLKQTVAGSIVIGIIASAVITLAALLPLLGVFRKKRPGKSGGPASAAGTAGHPGGNFRRRLRLYHHHRLRRHRHVCL
jgi:Na+-driven multidrug efflux pump